MAAIFRHPALPDYVLAAGGITVGMAADRVPSLVRDYEAGKLIHFPDLKLDIDHDFWAGLETEAHPGLRKLATVIDPARQDTILAKRLARAEAPAALAEGLHRNIMHLLDQVLPIYHGVFAGYRFVDPRAVWRLTTWRNRMMHFDSYEADYPDHFARMFINLDTQPRIWNTGYPTVELAARFGDRLTAEQRDAPPGRFWHHLRTAAFGAGPPLGDQPQHTLFFDPGDVWLVDSRQVAHQIFYGRRAVSIDFTVARETMLDPKVHYLASAERLQAGVRARQAEGAG